MSSECQVGRINDLATKTPLSLKFEQFYFKTRRKLGKIKLLKKVSKNKVKKQHPRYQNSNNSNTISTNNKIKDNDKVRKKSNLETSPLQPGDIVRVKSKEEIAQMLDDEDRFKNVLFMKEMWPLCNTKQKVLRRVEYFYDECALLMRRCKNTVLLEGLQCSGDMHWKHKCDRSCYFFWREEWLEKID